MSERAEIDPDGLLRVAVPPEVLVLGAGGLARRLAVGPLREHGIVVHDDHDHDHEPEHERVLAAEPDVAEDEPGAGLPEDELPEEIPPAGPADVPEQGATADPAGVVAGGNGTAPSPPPPPSPSSSGRPVVGLLVNPSSEHWTEAAGRQVPLVVLLLERPTDEGVVDAVLRGADAVVTAHEEPEELVAALDAVAAGGTVLTPHQARWVAEAARGRRREAEPVDALTRRELDILLSIDRGETVKQTARSLGISAKTVENLQSRLFRKLAVRNRAQAVSRAHALGLLSMAGGGDLPASLDLTTSDRQIQIRRPY